MTKQLKLSALFVALLASGTAVAGEASVQGYTVSGQSNEIVRNNYGECWKNAYFDKASQGRVECGDAVAAPEPEPEPEPEPAPVVVVEQAPQYVDETISCLPKPCSVSIRIHCAPKLKTT